MQDIGLGIWGAKMQESPVLSSLGPPWKAQTLCVLSLTSPGSLVHLSLLGPLGLPWMLQASK